MLRHDDDASIRDIYKTTMKYLQQHSFIFIMLLETVFLLLAAYYLVTYFKWRKNIHDPIEKLPGYRRLPILGTTYKFLGLGKADSFVAVNETIRKYGNIFRIWIGSKALVVILKPEYLEIIMSNSSHINKSQSLYGAILPWLGEGLLLSKGAKWFKHRKLITPTFHFKILENFMEIFVEKTEILLKNLDAKANGKMFNIYTDITNCALDIICETAMGVRINAMSNKDNDYVAAIYDISEIAVWKFRKPYIPNFIFNILPQGRSFNKDLAVLHGFTKNVIAQRKELLKNKTKVEISEEDEAIGKKKRTSFLDLLLEASEGSTVLTDTDIREEVDTFMFEGHDTTTSSMTWTLFLLGFYPEIQEKVFEEVRSVLQDKLTPTSIADLNELKYLECVIKESLRLFPPVSVIGRDMNQEVTLGDYNIPSGTEIIIQINGLHRNPECYPNPTKFDPDRFLPENSASRHPYAYVPFSAGPRNCIGQKFALYEEKTVLASIINRYRITAEENPDNVPKTIDIILRPINGVPIRLERRQ